MIPAFGWRSVLLAGGVVPLGLTVLLWTVLPESVRYMVCTAGRWSASAACSPASPRQAAQAQGFVLPEPAPMSGAVQSGISIVLSPSYRLGSFMLWLAYFMGLVIFYALINWMPVLFKEAGLDPKTATLISALFPLGGVGAVLFGWLMDRFNANRIIAAGYALTAVAIWAIGHAAAAWAGWWPPCSSPAR
jgi:AAHS family 4-hydroxybenzoate transporter-like MFS transporter